MKRNCLLLLCVGALFTCVPAKPQEKTQTTLEDLVRTSLERNREVRALRQRVAQARALARQAGVRPAPSLEGGGLSGSPLGSPGDQEFSAAFVQPIEAFGKRNNRVRTRPSARSTTKSRHRMLQAMSLSIIACGWFAHRCRPGCHDQSSPDQYGGACVCGHSKWSST
jgi:outer membrane protein TolC